MPRVVYLQPGDVLGAYRVLAVHTAASDARDRLYRVESTCCYTEMVRSHKVRDYAVIVAVADKIPNNVLEEDPKLLMWYDQAVTRMGGE